MAKPREWIFSFFPYAFSISWMDGGDFNSSTYDMRESIPQNLFNMIELLVGLIYLFFQIVGLERLNPY